VLFATTLTSCSFNRTFTNREEDKKEAEQVTTKLYELLKNKKYKESTELFSEKFFEISDKERLFDIYKMTEEKLGAVQETNIDSWETKVILGTDPVSTYVLVYKNKYDKFEATETFRLTKEADGKIRILAFRITSKAFEDLKPS
jgi:hypothetical protein